MIVEILFVFFRDIIYNYRYTIYIGGDIMKTKSCCFAGHADVRSNEIIELRLKNEIINLIENEGVTTFYNGAKGGFDMLCARCVNELKKEYPQIKSCWVLAYMPKENDEQHQEIARLFDEAIYPNLERVPPRVAILKRNEWMVDNSDFLIAYIEHTWGGAYKTLEYARKKQHILIHNIC